MCKYRDMGYYMGLDGGKNQERKEKELMERYVVVKDYLIDLLKVKGGFVFDSDKDSVFYEVVIDKMMRIIDDINVEMDYFIDEWIKEERYNDVKNGSKLVKEYNDRKDKELKNV